MTGKSITLIPQPLTQQAFSLFGDLVEVGGKPIMINEGTTERYHRLSDVTLGNDMSGSMGIINIFRAQPRTMPMNITMMERHPLGSQAFLPTNGLPYLVLVCLGKDAPDPDTLKLFIADGSGPSLQGVSYKANCWHHPLLALDQVTDFWVVDRLGSGNNLEEMDFDSTMNITIDRK
ncbi:MAG: ureidoglycolate lyase [Crocinitomicaceae bacterium]|jgi:ureidoglycolate lyase